MSLTDNPAASFRFDNIQTTEVRTALETIRDVIVTAADQQAATAVIQPLSLLASGLARLGA